MSDFNPAKTLADYLEKKNMHQVDFAKICGISYQSVSKYLSGSTIHRMIAHKIEKRTRGEILYSSLTKEKRKIRKNRTK